MENIKFIHFLKQATIRVKGQSYKVHRYLTVQIAKETDKLYYFKNTDNCLPLYNQLIPVRKSKEQIWDEKKMRYTKNPIDGLFRIKKHI